MEHRRRMRAPAAGGRVPRRQVSPGANVRFRHGPTGAVTDGDAVELGGIVSLVAVAHVEDVLFEDGLLAVGSGFGLRDVEGDGLGELGLGGEDPFELREEAPSLGFLGLSSRVLAPAMRVVSSKKSSGNMPRSYAMLCMASLERMGAHGEGD